MRKSRLSTLYKEQGVIHDTPGVTPMTPLDVAKQACGRADLSKVFAISPMISIVDGRLPDKAFRIRAFIAACSWDGPCPLAFEEIAFAVEGSRRQVIRHVALLGKLGYVAVIRCRNRRNSYSIPGVGQHATAIAGSKSCMESPNPGAVPAENLPKAVHCLKCRRRVKTLGKSGMCRGCTADADLAGKVEAARAELGSGATPEELAAHLKNARLAQRIRRILEKSERAA